MKKIVLSLLVAMVSFSASYAQVKYVTFTDSVKTTGAGNVEFRTMTELQDEQSYVLVGSYDDLSYELKNYYLKLDFLGNKLWDTVYTFQEPNPGQGWLDSEIQLIENGGTTIVATRATQMNFNYTAQPLLYAVNSQGIVDWNIVLTDEMMDFAKVRITPDNSGGVYMSTTSNVFGGAAKASTMKFGSLFSFDSSGNLQWAKNYTNIDTVEFGFDLLTANDLGEVFVAGVAHNGMSDNFFNVAKLTINGDVDWNTALHFDSIVPNFNWTDFIAINLLNDSSLVISFQYSNPQTEIPSYGLACYNAHTGSVNWIKSYSLESNFKGVVVSDAVAKNGELISTYKQEDEIFLSGILRIDSDGNILELKGVEEAQNFNDNEFKFIGNTSDGGFAMLQRPAAFPVNVNLLKTDENLNDWCSNNPNLIMPEVVDLTAVEYFIMDSVFDYNINTQSLNVSGEMTTSEIGNYCRCDLDIDGTVYDAIGMGMDSVRVALYKYDQAPGHYTVIADTITDVVGNYMFEFLPEGQYIVKAVPDQVKYPDYNQTYYGNPADVTQWDSAAVINLSCANADTVYDIDAFQTVPQAGMWTCNGYVFEFYGYEDLQAKKAPGDPLGDIDITVEQSPGGAISSTTTDQFGYYEFTGLNNNATFIIRPDLPGLPNDSIYTLTVTPGDGAMDSLNFYVDSVGVYILPDTLFTGVSQPKFQFENEQISLMPNPTTSLFTLTVNAVKDLNTEIEVVNMLGEVVYKKTYGVRSGEIKLEVDLANNSQGVYFVKLTRGSDFIIRKVVKQ